MNNIGKNEYLMDRPLFLVGIAWEKKYMKMEKRLRYQKYIYRKTLFRIRFIRFFSDKFTNEEQIKIV